jgi:hypothetical protein
MTGRFSILICIVIILSCSVKEKPITVHELASPSSSSAGEPYLYTDPSGQVFLSWIEKTDSMSLLKLSKLENNHWSPPTIVASDSNWFVNWADYPMAVGDGKGRMMAHVLDKSGDGTFSYDIKVTFNTDGQSWTEPVVLHDDAKQAEHGFVSLVPYDEHVFVSWLDGRNTVGDQAMEAGDHDHHGEMSVRAAIVNYEGKKLNEWQLDSRTCDCCQTTAAITSRGPVVIYRDRSEDEIRDIAIVRYVNNVWTEPQIIYSDNWKISGCPVNGPRCETLGTTLSVAWFSLNNNQPEVKVIFSGNDGETFGDPVLISNENPIGRVDLVLLDAQTALVSWVENSAVWVKRVYANGKTGEAVQVASTSEARSSGFPQITRSGNEVIAAWTDATSQTIKTARIEL